MKTKKYKKRKFSIKKGGKCQIGEKLGSGGAGNVFKCVKNKINDLDKVIKTFRDDLAFEEEKKIIYYVKKYIEFLPYNFSNLISKYNCYTNLENMNLNKQVKGVCEMEKLNFINTSGFDNINSLTSKKQFGGKGVGRISCDYKGGDYNQELMMQQQGPDLKEAHTKEYNSNSNYYNSVEEDELFNPRNTSLSTKDNEVRVQENKSKSININYSILLSSRSYSWNSFIKNLILSLYSLHVIGLIHRDIKPQNIGFSIKKNNSHYSKITDIISLIPSVVDYDTCIITDDLNKNIKLTTGFNNFDNNYKYIIAEGRSVGTVSYQSLAYIQMVNYFTDCNYLDYYSTKNTKAPYIIKSLKEKSKQLNTSKFTLNINNLLIQNTKKEVLLDYTNTLTILMANDLYSVILSIYMYIYNFCPEAAIKSKKYYTYLTKFNNVRGLVGIREFILKQENVPFDAIDICDYIPEKWKAIITDDFLRSIFIFDKNTALNILQFYKKIIALDKDYQEKIRSIEFNKLFEQKFLKNLTIIIFKSYNKSVFKLIYNYLFTELDVDLLREKNIYKAKIKNIIANILRTNKFNSLLPPNNLMLKRRCRELKDVEVLKELENSYKKKIKIVLDGFEEINLRLEKDEDKNEEHMLNLLINLFDENWVYRLKCYTKNLYDPIDKDFRVRFIVLID